MGQVCTKHKQKITQVHPDASPASLARTPLGSRNRNVYAYTGPETCTRIDITKYKLKPTPGAKNLVCDFSGTSGCFVCDLFNIKGLLLDKNTHIVAPGGKRLDNQETYEFIQSPTSGVCVKIFFDTDSSKMNYTKEKGSYKILRDLTEDTVSYLTTYAEYEGVNAFTVSFDSQSYDVFMNGNTIPVKRLQCLLFKKCNESLGLTLQDPDKKANFPVMEMVYNIGCVLQLLHKVGYCHADIKPENIVVCEQEPIRYKLIDYALKQYTKLEIPIAFTMKFLLPTLYQELTYNKKPTVPWDKKKENAYDKILQLTSTYNPYRHQKFLIKMSLDAFTEADIKAMAASQDYSLLYIKSDEYALAMTMMEAMDINTKKEFETAPKEVQTLVKRLISKEPYFRDTPLDKCKQMATRLATRIATARSATVSRI